MEKRKHLYSLKFIGLKGDDMPELNFFEDVQYLEPRCPKCKIVVDYGANTRYDDAKGKHVCLNCGEILK